MSIATTIKRRLRAAIPPVIFLLLAVYFGWNAMRGDRGLVAQQQDGRRGEALRHRRDPEHRVRVRRRPAVAARAEPGGVHEDAAGDNAIGDRGLGAAVKVVADDGIDGGEVTAHPFSLARL